MIIMTMLQTVLSGLLQGCAEDEFHLSDIPERAKRLQQLAKDGDLGQLKKCLKSGHYRQLVNFKNHLRCTPLRLAASEGHTKCVRCLLEHGADVDTPDLKAQTPLLAALKGNHLECAAELLRNGASPNGNKMHMTGPLYYMAMQGRLEGMKLLLECGADPDGVKRDKEYSFQSPPLQVALIYKYNDCFKILLQYGADPNYVKNTEPEPQSILLYQCAIKYKCDMVIFELLYEAGADIYAKDSTNRYSWMAEKRAEVPVYDYLRNASENPRSLKSACRLSIRKCLGKRRLKDIELLEIPVSLKTYLKYQDIRYQK